MANIIITSHYTMGDVLPFFRLALRLKERKHNVTFLTHGAFKDMAVKAGLNFLPWDEAEDYPQILKDIGMIGDPLNSSDQYREFNNKYHGKDKCINEYNIISNQCSMENTVIVARHRSSSSSYLVAEKLGIPIVAIFLAPTYVTHLPSQEELFGDIMAEEINEIRNQLDFKPIKNWISWVSCTKKCIGFWPSWFAKNQADWPFEIEAVGFPLVTEIEKQSIPDSVEAFIGNGEPPILISGGTSMLLKANFYQVAVDACKILKHPAILVSDHEELVPHDLPDYIKWYRFLPLGSLMHRMKVVIHHGGIGTLSGAMQAGVPQLSLAADTDRPDNAKRLEALGIGEYLPPIKWKPELIAERLQALMTPKVRVACKEISEKMLKENPMDRACEFIEKAVGNDEFLIQSKTFIKEYSIKSHNEGELKTEVNEKIIENLSPVKKALMLQMLRRKKNGGL